MSWVNLASGVSKGINAVGSGMASDISARANAGWDDYQAKVETDIAMKTAQLIRRRGETQVGAADASYAAAGVKVGEAGSSSQEVERRIYQDTEHDAFQAILQGQRRAIALRTEGQMQRINGNLLKQTGYVNAASGIASSVAQGYSNWKTMQPADTPMSIDTSGYNYSGDEGGALFSAKGSDIRGRH